MRFALLLGLFFALTSCACKNAPAKESVGLTFATELEWQPLFKGVDRADMAVTKPRRMKGHAVRIDLKSTGIGFTVTPDNGERELETDGMRTSNFLALRKCQVAINSAPFSPVSNDEGDVHDVNGLLVGDGKKISNAVGERPALLITKDKGALIAVPPFNLDNISQAVGGFGLVLVDDKIVATGTKRHPRTAAGISDDGRYLYLLVIDGRQVRSAGASTVETGQWLQALGASQGINLDGGGTTTMVFEEDGKPKVINKPIHLGRPGLERPSGAHLGVFADRLP